jgi:hypothetical protein
LFYREQCESTEGPIHVTLTCAKNIKLFSEADVVNKWTIDESTNLIHSKNNPAETLLLVSSVVASRTRNTQILVAVNATDMKDTQSEFSLLRSTRIFGGACNV